MRAIGWAILTVLVGVGVAAADPPKAREKVPAKVGEIVTFSVSVEKGKRLGWHPAFDKADCTVVRLWSDDAETYEFLAQPKKPGAFTVVWWTVGEGKGSATAIGGSADLPPPIDPPPPTPGSKSYLLVVQPPRAGVGGGLPKDYETVMENPAWAALKAAGIKVGDISAAEARSEYRYPATAPVPGVMFLRVTDGKAVFVGQPVPLPTTADGIKALGDRFK